MDFCVKCGKKEVYMESLCKECYQKEYPFAKKKKRKTKKKTAGEKHSGYFEAILQLRNPSQKLVNFVEKELERKNIKVAKVEEVKNGLDYYLPDSKLTQNLGRELQKRFGGILKVSRKLHTVSKETSKRVYRLTVLFRKPDFEIGDVIHYKDRDYRINDLGKQVFVSDVETGKRRKITFKELEKAKLI